VTVPRPDPGPGKSDQMLAGLLAHGSSDRAGPSRVSYGDRTFPVAAGAPQPAEPPSRPHRLQLQEPPWLQQRCRL